MIRRPRIEHLASATLAAFVATVAMPPPGILVHLPAGGTRAHVRLDGGSCAPDDDRRAPGASAWRGVMPTRRLVLAAAVVSLAALGHSAGSDQCPPGAPPDLCRGPTPSLHDIPGDGIEQNDQRYLYGARARYTRFWTLGAFPTESRLQVETRNDQIHVALYRQVERRRFFTGNRLAGDERSASRRYGVDVESLFRVTRRLTADYDLSYADPRFRNGDAIPLAPTLLMNGGLTLDLGHGLSTALRLRFLDDRPAIEDRSLIARGYTLLDLIARWRWRNVEASLALLNLTDTDWREAQFADTSCVRREVVPGGFPPKGNPGRNGFRFPCVAQPGKQTDHPLEPAPDIHFTPGNPLGVRAGITVFF